MDQNLNTSPQESENTPHQDLPGFARSNQRKILSVVIGALVLFFVVFLLANLISGKAPFKAGEKVTINNHSYKVKVAESEKEKEIGLSKIDKMPKDYGMLFPFGKSGYYFFWMRDMKFSLDIIYINKGKIVNVFSKVEPPKNNESPRVFTSGKEADTVLEINSQESEKYKFKEGDGVSVSKI